MARLHASPLFRENVPHPTRWFSDNKKTYAKLVAEDILIRAFINKKFAADLIVDLEISRSGKNTVVNILTTRPSEIIGEGEDFQKIQKDIMSINADIKLTVKEPSKPEYYPRVHGEAIVKELMIKSNLRTFIRRLFQNLKKTYVKGMRIVVSGRLQGATMAKTKVYNFGNVPRNDLSSYVVEYVTVAQTTSGSCGVRVTMCVKQSNYEERAHRTFDRYAKNNEEKKDEHNRYRGNRTNYNNKRSE